jgi:F-type H+-transporting ATPase subunit epsilon
MASENDETGDAFPCVILTPERTVFEGRITRLAGEDLRGAFEVLPRHEPLMTPLRISLFEVEEPGGGTKRFAVHGGFLDMTGTEATLLADSAESAEEIDVERAKEAMARARERLAEVTRSAEEIALDHDRAEMALKRALIRLQARQIPLPEE